MAKEISQHEGRKYLRTIVSAVDSKTTVEVDVYAVIAAFGVTCPGRQQAIKKLLCAGGRGKGDAMADLIGADAALSRAIQLQKIEDTGRRAELVAALKAAPKTAEGGCIVEAPKVSVKRAKKKQVK